MRCHVRCAHPGRLPGVSDSPGPYTYLPPNKWEFPDCTFSMAGDEFVTVSERQAELQLHITMHHSRSGIEDRNKCQTQTKVDCSALKAKTSATEWIL